MKLKGLSEKQLFEMGAALFYADGNIGDFTELVHLIGERLEIEAIGGEGYDTTVGRCCYMALGLYDETPTAKDRIFEIMNVIMLTSGDERNTIVFRALDGGDTETALGVLDSWAKTSDDAKWLAQGIRTILRQTRKYASIHT
jgi:hypothetical protein